MSKIKIINRYYSNNHCIESEDENIIENMGNSFCYHGNAFTS